MVSKYINTGSQFDTDQFIVVENSIVEKKMHDIVERIKDYDDRLEVLCVDPNNCAFSEAPFVLAEVTPSGEVFKVFEFWELNDAILERIYLADTRRVDVLLAIDKHNAQVKADRDRRYQEARDEKIDLVSTIVKGMRTKSEFSIRRDSGEKVTFYEDRPAKEHVNEHSRGSNSG